MSNTRSHDLGKEYDTICNPGFGGEVYGVVIIWGQKYFWHLS